MIDVGASSYLLKNTDPKTVIHTIKEVHEKGFYYDEKVLKIIHENIISSSGKRIKSDLDKKLYCRTLFQSVFSMMEFFTSITEFR